jgi:hypothetical protein
MVLLCLRDNMAKAVRHCSATSIHSMDSSFCKKTGIASTTTVDDRGRASIMYVRARQACVIITKLCSMLRRLIRAATTCFTGKPVSVSSLPITRISPMPMTAWSCSPSSSTACKPAKSCWAFAAEIDR